MRNADILIALDISSSISRDEFEKRKQLLADFVARFPVNKNDVHFALIHYNHFIHTYFTFENPDFYNVHAVQKTILQVPLLGGATLTQKALDVALKVFSRPEYGARSTSRKTLIIVTDGYTYGGEKTLELPSTKLQVYIKAYLHDSRLVVYDPYPSVCDGINTHKILTLIFIR